MQENTKNAPCSFLNAHCNLLPSVTRFTKSIMFYVSECTVQIMVHSWMRVVQDLEHKIWWLVISICYMQETNQNHCLFLQKNIVTETCKGFTICIKIFKERVMPINNISRFLGHLGHGTGFENIISTYDFRGTWGLLVSVHWGTFRDSS